MDGARAIVEADIGFEVAKFVANTGVTRNTQVASLGGSAMQEQSPSLQSRPRPCLLPGIP